MPIEPTLHLGSQSSGAGAGKVTFNPFSITRRVDRESTYHPAKVTVPDLKLS
jgi:hypothetical protein